MKHKFLILIALVIKLPCFGQLQINAGDDLVVCSDLWQTELPTLGGNPTATGGIEPYTYCWSITYHDYFGTRSASYFFDDTTTANPTLINFVDDSLVFSLSVMDSIGNQAKDSIKIWFSEFYYILMDCIDFINQGDSAYHLFPTPSNHNDPHTYAWSPNYNISDTTAHSPIVWPDTSVTYTVLVTDSYGCTATSQCIITVIPLNIYLFENPVIHSYVYPNPIKSNSVLTIENSRIDRARLKIYNTNGSLIFDDIINNSFNIGKIINLSGLYYYSLIDDNIILSQGHFVKK